MLLAHPDQVLPEWILDAVILGIDGRLKGTRGRRKRPRLLRSNGHWLKTKYERTLRWLQQREKSIGLQGWSLLRGKHWWKGPPHERAARIVISQFKLRIDCARLPQSHLFTLIGRFVVKVRCKKRR